MRTQFDQGGGSTGILTNKMAIARQFGVKQSEVIYFSAGVDLYGYKVIYDKTTQRAYSLPSDITAGTTAVSLSVAAVLVHSKGTVDLGALAVSRSEYVTLPGSFSSGSTINVKNECLEYQGSLYRWDGLFLPSGKVVPAGSTPDSSGGVGPGKWLSVGDAALRGELANPVFGDALLGVKQPIAMAIGRTQHGKNAEFVNVFDFGAIGDGTLHPLSERFTTLAMAQVAYPFVTSLTQSIDWAALQAAVNSGLRVRFTSLGREVDFAVNEEIAVRTAGQVLEFDNEGGYGYADFNVGASWQKSGVRIIAMGTFARRIRTRRLYRASSTDPQDTPLSVVFNIQAEGVQMYSPCIWLNCDYSDPSPTNFGDDCDVGIFIGTRVGVQIHDPVVIGYFRKVGIYFDVTQSDELPRFPDINGVPYPDGSNKNLGDGTHIYNPYIRGSRVGLGILGAKPKTGQNTYTDPYYDQVLGASVPDFRGRGGFSDFMCLGGRIFGPDHHSTWRLQDPTLVGGVLTQAGMESEPDFSPAAVHIDGLANNASSNLWGMRFFGTRIATWEMFRVRLDKASRVVFDKCHIEGRNSTDIRSATGAALPGAGTNDYTLNTYGAVAGTSRTTRCAYYDAVTSTVEDTIPHWYGTQFQLQARDGSRIFMADGGYISTVKGNLDLRAPAGSSVLVRNGTTTVMQVGSDGIALGANDTYRAGSSASAFTEIWARALRTTLSTSPGGPGPGIYSGEGSPEGVVTAVTGSKYYRTGSTTNATLAREWIKDSGNGNTGWIAR